MDVHDPPREGLKDRRADDAHVACQADEVDPALLQDGLKPSGVGFGARVSLGVEMDAFNLVPAGPAEGFGAAAVRDDHRDRSGKVSFLAGVDYRLQVRTAAGSEDT